MNSYTIKPSRNGDHYYAAETIVPWVQTGVLTAEAEEKNWERA